MTPLLFATSRGGYTNFIRFLLKAGADPNIPDDVCFLCFLGFLLYPAFHCVLVKLLLILLLHSDYVGRCIAI
jgi:hypothetical protein